MAIDEAEDEWSQHNSKKLIDTSEKGLRGSIPKDFPYFHVEFGLNKGFVHVMDDEKQFKSNFGLNVIRGMLRLAEEDMYGRRKHDSGLFWEVGVFSLWGVVWAKLCCGCVCGGFVVFGGVQMCWLNPSGWN
ncbi:unnamed protein product [Camellia sinensis]